MLSGDEVLFELGSAYSLTQAAARIYQYLSQVDELGVDIIFVEPLPLQGIGYAVMNRLHKVVGGK